MKCIHVLRKPCSRSAPTVAANVLRYGTGALNIGATRIHSGPSEGESTSGETALGQGSGWNAHNNRTTAIDRTMASGRWPANLVLQHLEGCRQTGARNIKAPGAKNNVQHTNSKDGLVFVFKSTPRSEVCHRNEDGTETIAAYDCAPGCPVAALDEQSGKLTSGTGAESRPEGTPMVSYGDAGGASRFFKQFVGKSE